jgi:Fe-S cluster assembly iron-binding protein IscA
LESGVSQVIRSILTDKGIQQPIIRINLHFSGCCDPSLHLCVDTILESDLIQEVDDLRFAIDPETYQLVGEVTISCMDDMGRKGFVLTSSKPLSEWHGFGASTIKIRSTL